MLHKIVTNRVVHRYRQSLSHDLQATLINKSSIHSYLGMLRHYNSIRLLKEMGFDPTIR